MTDALRVLLAVTGAEELAAVMAPYPEWWRHRTSSPEERKRARDAIAEEMRRR